MRLVRALLLGGLQMACNYPVFMMGLDFAADMGRVYGLSIAMKAIYSSRFCRLGGQTPDIILTI